MGQEKLVLATRLHAHLRHVRGAGATRRTTTHAAEVDEHQNQRGDHGGPQEPQESTAGLQLTTTLLVVVGTEADPVGTAALDSQLATAVDGVQLGGDDNGGDEREQDSQGVETKKDVAKDALSQHGEESAGHAEQAGQPGDDDGEERIVDGGHVAVNVAGNHVTEKGNSDNDEEELHAADDEKTGALHCD